MFARSFKSALKSAVAVAICGGALSAALPGTASAAVIGYVASPTTNSADWSNAVTGLGATVNTAVNFNAMSVGALNGSFYSASQGVTMSQTGGIVVSTGCCNGGYGGTSVGEGAWSPSGLLRANSAALSATPAQSVTFTFDTDVYGAGIFLVDYVGGTPWSITARDENNAILGTYTSITGTSFQLMGGGYNPTTGPYKYFLGIESTLGNIASVTIGRPGISLYQSGDIVGLDDFRFATMAAASSVPEPASLALLGLGLLGLGVARRRLVK